MAHGAPGTDPTRSVLAARQHHRRHGDMDGNTCLLSACALHYPVDGMARLEHDVVTLPPDQQALGLVESMFVRVAHLQLETATLQGDIERLKVLLEKQS